MGTGMIDNQRFSGINIQILKVCNYNLDEIDSFIEQFKDFRNEIKQKRQLRSCLFLCQTIL